MENNNSSKLSNIFSTINNSITNLINKKPTDIKNNFTNTKCYMAEYSSFNKIIIIIILILGIIGIYIADNLKTN